MAWTYNRDNLGRITMIAENNGTSTFAREFQYDLAGRLTTVIEDGEIVESYGYLVTVAPGTGVYGKPANVLGEDGAAL